MSRGEKTPPDLKESFNGGPLTVPEGMDDPEAMAFCYQPTLWPDLPGFRKAWETYYRAMEELAARVMRAFAEALGFRETTSTPTSARRSRPCGRCIIRPRKAPPRRDSSGPGPYGLRVADHPSAAAGFPGA